MALGQGGLGWFHCQQLTCFLRMYIFQMWERACSRRRPDRRPFSFLVYISISAVTAANGSALTACHFGKRRGAGPAQRKQRSRPERPAPRLGSAFLRSGIHPGTLPSGLLRYDLHAACSTASNGAARHSPDAHLHSASRRGGQIKSCRRANARPVEW